MKSINYRLYLYELILVSLVIFAHASFNVIPMYLDSLGRATVIFFFILSSYFYNRELSRDDYTYRDTLKRCLRLLIISLIVVSIYLIIFIPIRLSILGTPTSFINFFEAYMPNLTFMWFIGALIICYLIYPLIHKIKFIHSSRYMIVIPIIILLCVYIYRIIAGIYDLGFFSRLEITRNHLFTGLPCFLIGTYIYNRFNSIKRIKPIWFYLSLLLLLGTTILEVYIHILVHTIQNEFYISSIIGYILIFIYCLQKPLSKIGNGLYKILGRTGPSIIYLFHILFLYIFGFLYQYDYGFIYVIILTIISCLLLGVIYNLIKTLIYNHR